MRMSFSQLVENNEISFHLVYFVLPCNIPEVNMICLNCYNHFFNCTGMQNPHDKGCLLDARGDEGKKLGKYFSNMVSDKIFNLVKQEIGLNE